MAPVDGASVDGVPAEGAKESGVDAGAAGPDCAEAG